MLLICALMDEKRLSHFLIICSLLGMDALVETHDEEEIKMAEKAFVNGGTVGNSKVLIKLADKYSVDIPLRTRGWIVNSLIECIVSECGVIQYRFRRKKGNRGSGRISEILIKLQTTIQNVQTANTGRKL